MKRILLMFLCFLLGIIAAYFCSGCLTVNKFYPDKPNYIYGIPPGKPTLGKKHHLSLSDRTIECECGWKCDRDVNAALVILRKGLGLNPEQAVGLDRPELKPLEREAAARILGSNPYICVSFP